MPPRKKNSSRRTKDKRNKRDKKDKRDKKNKEVDIHKQFKPNKKPKAVFRAGAFGGTYFRPIHSSLTGKNHNGSLKEYPEDWFKGMDVKKKVIKELEEDEDLKEWWDRCREMVSWDIESLKNNQHKF